ncbi:MAG: DUF4160 domain-containing protein [Holophagaceae bacterium]|nr:DUF4160 domain-containing protein [Holophagaceae bacterium]
MHQEIETQHHIPHIHAQYSGHEISISLDGAILAGGFPKNKLKLLEAWMELHKEDDVKT